MNTLRYIPESEIICMCIFLLMTLIVNCIADEELCEAKNNFRWDSAKQRCKTCKKCPFGKGRNFTSNIVLPRDEHGDLKCIPCRRCSKGTFDVTFNDDCQDCNFKKCALEHKHVAFECSIRQDVICGSCLSGFVDLYNSQDFPCYEDKTSRETPNTQTNEKTVQEIIKTSAEYSSDVHTFDRKQNVTGLKTTNLQSKDKRLLDTSDEVSDIAIVSGCILVVFIGTVVAVVVVVVTMYVRRKRGRRFQVLPFYNAAQVTDPQDPSGADNDIEIDGLQDTAVRGEVASVPLMRSPRPELSSPYTSSPGHEAFRGSTTEYFSRITNQDQVCKCDLSPESTCDSCGVFSDKFRDMKIMRGDEIISIVARNVCHNPLPLFHYLKIPDYVIYQVDDDRQRQPDQFSQKEFIHRTLNVWLENTPEDLSKLSNALCICKFHHINHEIKQHLDEKVSKSSPVDVNSSTIASMT